MTRAQRIEYEILDCALHGWMRSEGYATTVGGFAERLRQCFPDIQHQEFTEACKRLFQQQALDLRKLDNSGAVVGLLDFRGTREDEMAFFADARAVFYLRPRPLSQTYFGRLSAHLEAPSGFRRGRLRR